MIYDSLSEPVEEQVAEVYKDFKVAGLVDPDTNSINNATSSQREFTIATFLQNSWSRSTLL